VAPQLEKLLIIGAATPTIIRVIDDINDSGSRHIKIVGFLDNAYAALGSHFHGFEILGGFDAVRAYKPESVVLINTIASDPKVRVATTEAFITLGYRFTNIIHPRVNTRYVEMGIGNVVYENALIHPFVRIGNHCVISSNAGIAHDSTIGDYCFVGPASYVCGKVDIEGGVYIGSGAKILPRLKIGQNAKIGAASLVTRSVSEGQLIVGVPGMPRKLSEPTDAVAALSRIMEGVGSGQLTASEAHLLVGIVEAALKALEVFNIDQQFSDSTFYKWKAKFGLEVSKGQRLNALEDR
jgi:sugar O-acyltransferase (sialic acid O-acetyltransferase NeuD family)